MAVAQMLNLRSGDIANIIVLLVTLTFVIAISLNVSEKGDFIASSYIEEGFCVSWETQPYNGMLSSHALCFYTDTFFAIFLGTLCYLRKDDSRLERVRKNYLGIFGHGLGHLMLALNSDDSVSTLAQE